MGKLYAEEAEVKEAIEAVEVFKAGGTPSKEEAEEMRRIGATRASFMIDPLPLGHIDKGAFDVRLWDSTSCFYDDPTCCSFLRSRVQNKGGCDACVVPTVNAVTTAPGLSGGESRFLFVWR